VDQNVSTIHMCKYRPIGHFAGWNMSSFLDITGLAANSNLSASKSMFEMVL